MAKARKLLIQYEGGNEGLDIEISTAKDFSGLTTPQSLLNKDTLKVAFHCDDGYRVLGNNGDVIYVAGFRFDPDPYRDYKRKKNDCYETQAGPRLAKIEFHEAARKIIVTETLRGKKDWRVEYKFKGFHPL